MPQVCGTPFDRHQNHKNNILFFSLIVEAYKKGIMKGGAAIPPPGNLPGSKLKLLFTRYFHDLFNYNNFNF